jgi:hypothetical protein
MEAKHDLIVDHTQVACRYSVRLEKPVLAEDDPGVLEADHHGLVSSMTDAEVTVSGLPAQANAEDMSRWSRWLVLRSWGRSNLMSVYREQQRVIVEAAAGSEKAACSADKSSAMAALRCTSRIDGEHEDPQVNMECKHAPVMAIVAGPEWAERRGRP